MFRALLVVVLLGCGARPSLEVGEVDAGIVRCPAKRADGANCARSLKTCTYIDLEDTCGNNDCACGQPELKCSSTPGCTPGINHLTWCRPGGSCTTGNGCVVESCARNCVCIDGKYNCVADSCG